MHHEARDETVAQTLLEVPQTGQCIGRDIDGCLDFDAHDSSICRFEQKVDLLPVPIPPMVETGVNVGPRQLARQLTGYERLQELS